MSAEQARSEDSEFEQRARTLLLQSAEQLPGSVRSRLTQARYAALTARPVHAPSFARRWVPAGAAVAAVLALLVLYVPSGRGPADNPIANAGLEDIELLTDNDAVLLNGDAEVDYDFYEWAAEEADGSAASAVGS